MNQKLFILPKDILLQLQYKQLMIVSAKILVLKYCSNILILNIITFNTFYYIKD